MTKTEIADYQKHFDEFDDWKSLKMAWLYTVQMQAFDGEVEQHCFKVTELAILHGVLIEWAETEDHYGIFEDLQLLVFATWAVFTRLNMQCECLEPLYLPRWCYPKMKDALRFL